MTITHKTMQTINNSLKRQAFLVSRRPCSKDIKKHAKSIV